MPSKINLIFRVGLISFILLPMHDLFNYIFSNSALVVWKQVLALLFLLSLTVYPWSARLNDAWLKRIHRMYVVMAFLSFIAVLSSIINGLSLYRILYGSFAYVGFIGGALFAYIVVKKKYELSFYKFSFLIGLASSVGIIIDYYSPLFDFLPRSAGNDLYTQIANDHFRRASFLFGTSTTVYPFLAFTLLTTALSLSTEKSFAANLRLITLSSIILAAIFLTGSRANFILMIAFTLSIYLIFLVQNPLRFLYSAPLIITAISIVLWLVVGSAFQLDMFFDRYLNPFSLSDESNLGRLSDWTSGLSLFWNFGFEWLLGIGVGSSLGMISDGFIVSEHYESSFFQSFSEIGVVGLMLRFYPLWLALTYFVKNIRKVTSNDVMIFSWLVCYFISVFVSPTAAAYHTQIIYFFVCSMAMRPMLKTHF